ncbi:hypothetical protein EPN81_01105 [Patescibacteria group bacterium]|nr:MAG: hypothetical protein EPN81_01105 [Patescibacteria group bacterium]
MIGFLVFGTVALLGVYPLISAIIKIRWGWDFHQYLWGEPMWETLPGTEGQILVRNNLIAIYYGTFVLEGFIAVSLATVFVPETTARRMFLGFCLFCTFAPFMAQPICRRKFKINLIELLVQSML